MSDIVELEHPVIEVSIGFGSSESKQYAEAASASATAAAESAESIEESAAQIAQNTTDISSLRSDLSGLKNVLYFDSSDMDFVIGSIDANTGEDSKWAYTIRSGMKILSEDTIINFTGVSRVLFAFFYDSDSTYISPRVSPVGGTFTVPSNASFVRFIYGFSSSSGTTVESYGFDKLVSEFSLSVKSKLQDEVDDVKTKAENDYGPLGYLNDGTDFNDCTTTGFYRLISSYTYENDPLPNVGKMLMINNNDDNLITQFVFSISNKAYGRIKYSSGWTDWEEIVSYSDLTSVLAERDKKEILYDNVSAVLNIAETYFNEAYNPDNQIVYTSTHGLFTDVVVPDGEDDAGKKSIVCSQFVQACIGAIPYSNSRYVLGNTSKNDPLWWGFQSDGTGVYYGDSGKTEDHIEAGLYCKDYMRASELYNYFSSKGILHTFNVDHNDLKPGDICFYLASVWEPEKKGTSYDYISHVAVCLRPYKTHYAIMHSCDDNKRLYDDKEAGVLTSDWSYEAAAPTAYVHLDDIPIQKSQVISNLVSAKTFDTSGTIEDGSTVYIGSFTDSLEKGFYTVNIENSGASDGYIKVTYNTGDQVNFYAENMCNVSSIVFYAQLAVQKIDVRVYNGTTYNVSNVNLYKGYHTPDMN